MITLDNIYKSFQFDIPNHLRPKIFDSSAQLIGHLPKKLFCICVHVSSFTTIKWRLEFQTSVHQ